MTLRRLSWPVLALLVGCSGSAPLTVSATKATCDPDFPETCPKPPPPKNLTPPNVGIAMVCDTDAPLFPASQDVRFWNGTSLWNGHSGVLVPYYTPNTVDLPDRRVQIFGVDVANQQIVFSVFADENWAPPYFSALDSMTGTLKQHPNCAGDNNNSGASQVSAGHPPGSPPSTNGGPICGDGPCPCEHTSFGWVLDDARSRICP